MCACMCVWVCLCGHVCVRAHACVSCATWGLVYVFYVCMYFRHALLLSLVLNYYFFR